MRLTRRGQVLVPFHHRLGGHLFSRLLVFGQGGRNGQHDAQHGNCERNEMHGCLLVCDRVMSTSNENLFDCPCMYRRRSCFPVNCLAAMQKSDQTSRRLSVPPPSVLPASHHEYAWRPTSDA